MYVVTRELELIIMIIKITKIEVIVIKVAVKVARYVLRNSCLRNHKIYLKISVMESFNSRVLTSGPPALLKTASIAYILL